MKEITVKNLENEVVDQLDAIAADQGQNLDDFVGAALTQIVNNHAARKNSHLGSRIAARFRGIGLSEDESLPELPRQNVRNPFGEGP